MILKRLANPNVHILKFFLESQTGSKSLTHFKEIFPNNASYLFFWVSGMFENLLKA
jgi:hypothetical protein